MIVDLYSGARGWDEGARLLGIDGIVGVELDEWACRTSVAAGHPVIRADVERYPAGHLAGRVDVLIESPPCQTFSTAGKGAGRVIETELRAAVADAVAGRRNLGAHRRAMVRTLAAAMPRKTVRSARMQARRTPGQPRWVETEPWTRAERTAEAQAQVRGATQVVVAARWIYDVRPRAIALEQVPAVLPLWQAMRPGLERLGYSVAVGLLSSEQYGVPQTRRRAVLVARLDGEARLPEPTHRPYRRGVPQHEGDARLLPWRSMADALPHRGPFTVISNYGTGGDPKNRGRRTHREPAFTVTGKISRLRLVDPDGRELPRLTPSEAGLLQGFPADWPWSGNDIAQQIGNACPVPLAAALAEAATAPALGVAA